MAKKAVNGDTTVDSSTSEATSGGDEGVNKTALFAKAMETLGSKAKPLAIQAWLKEHYHIDFKLTLISTYKSNWRRKNGKRGPGRPKSEKVKPSAVPTTKAVAEPSLDEIRQINSMLHRIGEKGIHEIIELLNGL